MGFHLPEIIKKSIVTTKGDLLIATGAGVIVRRGVGADGEVLTADSAQSDGVKFATGGAGGDAVITVAADNTPATLKDRADYVCDGVDDDVQINAALAAADTVLLCPGTFIIANEITLDTDQTLMGNGMGTIIKLKDAHNAAINMISNANFAAAGVDRITVRDLQIDGNKGAQSSGNHYGIFFRPTGQATPTIIGCHVINVVVHDCRISGMIFYDMNHSTIWGCDSYLNDMTGLSAQNCDYLIVAHCNISENGFEGLEVQTGQHNVYANNNIYKNVDLGLKAGDDYSTYIGNNIYLNGAEGILCRASYSTFTGNRVQQNTEHGFSASAEGNLVITGNLIRYNTWDGIRVDTCESVVISGNELRDNGRHGIYLLDGSVDVAITGNVITGNGRIAGAYDNIRLANINYCLISNNLIRKGLSGEKRDYGINIFDAACVGNIVRDNDLYDGGDTGLINDAGTGTKFNNITFQFIQGTTFISADGSAKGWEIDLDTEFAIALGQLPLELLQVVRIKIWAVGLAAPGAANQMTLEININAGQDDEVFTAEAIAIVNKLNTTENFTINDIIHWILTSADDADIGDLIGGDSLEVKVKHEAAVASDIATDAVFRAVEIEYVT